MIPITGKRFGPSQSFGKRPIRSPRGFISLLHREPLEAPYACWQARSGASPATTAEGSNWIRHPLIKHERAFGQLIDLDLHDLTVRDDLWDLLLKPQGHLPVE
jgi:hypothetical protein